MTPSPHFLYLQAPVFKGLVSSSYTSWTRHPLNGERNVPVTSPASRLERIPNHARIFLQSRPKYPPVTGSPQDHWSGSGVAPSATGYRNDRGSQNNALLAPKRLPAFTPWRQRNGEASREVPRWADLGSVAFFRGNEPRTTKKSTHAAGGCERLQPVERCTTRSSLTGLLSGAGCCLPSAIGRAVAEVVVGCRSSALG